MFDQIPNMAQKYVLKRINKGLVLKSAYLCSFGGNQSIQNAEQNIQNRIYCFVL